MSIDHQYHQASFDELLTLTPLRETTFLVVDLETTGTRADSDTITEIGAVKIRGGENLGEFSTLVKPTTSISPLITALTGITPHMVETAPTIEAVLPAFLEFATGAVWVAHNAPFDIGFLKAACVRHGYPWPRPKVVDTVTLARRILQREEVPNNKLGTLARYFGAETIPTHRALPDARATVDVLHGLLARVGNLGITTLTELTAYSSQVTAAQRAKRHLADPLPTTPGVYIFRAADDRPLYVGTSKNLYARVRNYFRASEPRARMREMIALTERIEAIPCAHALEAHIRELRIIAAHKPPYNRRDKYPERTLWLKLTNEAYPRLSLVHTVNYDPAWVDGLPNQRYLGPFSSQTAARAAAAAIHEALPIRQCTTRLSVRTPSTACALAELGKCGAPCEHRESVADYHTHVNALVAAINTDPEPLMAPLLTAISTRAAAQRFEDAARLRDHLTTLLRVIGRAQRLQAINTVPELVAAQRNPVGGWDLAIIRHGRLAAAATAAHASEVLPLVSLLQASAQTVPTTTGLRANVAETEHVLRWLQQPSTRVVHITGQWLSPVQGAGRWGALLAKLSAARLDEPSQARSKR